ncbi:MAG: tRNA(Met) cytidine acetyltransferase, partial [Bdellovibrio bacteriovorus]
LISFWHACGYRPVQMGTSRNAASGEHAILMLRPLSAGGRRLADRAEWRLEQRLGVLLAGPLRHLDPLAAAALARALDASAESPCTEPDRDCDEAWVDPDAEIDGFAQGHRTLEAALPLLCELVRRRLGAGLRAGIIGLEDGALLVATARQLRPVNELVALAGAPGRQALIQRLRALVGRIARD